jgi:hypothetical protein
MRQKTLDWYLSRIEEFYAELTRVSRHSGYVLDFFRGEVSDCKVEFEEMSIEEFRRIYENDPPEDRKRNSFFLEDDECLQKILRCLAPRGYKAAFNFTAPDAILGNVTLEIGDK